MQILRENPTTKNEFLRYQIGRMETRLETEPVYVQTGPDPKDLVMTGHRTGKAFVAVFRLLGFGSTLKSAEAMAARAA